MIPGQPTLLYRSRSTESRPDFSDLPPRCQLPSRVRRRGSAQLALGGSERPAAFASRASLQQEEHYVASRWPVKSVPGGLNHTAVICSRHPVCGSAARGTRGTSRPPSAPHVRQRQLPAGDARTPANERFPRRSTSTPPGSRSSDPGTYSGSFTFSLLR